MFPPCNAVYVDTLYYGVANGDENKKCIWRQAVSLPSPLYITEAPKVFEVLTKKLLRAVFEFSVSVDPLIRCQSIIPWIVSHADSSEPGEDVPGDAASEHEEESEEPHGGPGMVLPLPLEEGLHNRVPKVNFFKLVNL